MISIGGLALCLLFVGEKAIGFFETTRSTKLQATWVADIPQAVAWAIEHASSNAIFLLKGSREAQLDVFIPEYQAALRVTHALS